MTDQVSIPREIAQELLTLAEEMRAKALAEVLHDAIAKGMQPVPQSPARTDDAFLDLMATALDGLNEVTITEALAAIGVHEPSRDLNTRAAICLRKLGWDRFEKRCGDPRFVFRRTQSSATAIEYPQEQTK